ncbi:energy-coupled thiamine transporter ThiT [Streptococcus cuniculipharyngis]|uniref:Energy-coupled thiamine transporter ThiT n=1 Tax=Streptococcus cuniculipharyngis TaxID=1562651 RepID=A0A5C5SBW9_9STRE|nr:energy-coupled thiamine transporter ThiT [Streptococcus cuniculipharyngis]TWS98054.1 energy-coupled thiamine transporter ThiT [Streptococcus cuniculipharyngis]
MPKLSTSQKTERALLLALSLLLDKLILFQLPQGGSISLGMLPVIIFALRYGPISGCLLGSLSGQLQLFLGGYFLSPWQFFLDYPIAYGLLGLAGLATRQKNLSHRPVLLAFAIGLASLGRLVAHTLAGILFYSDYAPKGSPVWLYALTYNAGFLIPSAIISYLLLLILLKKIPRLLIPGYNR